jgi:hypothetical protein
VAAAQTIARTRRPGAVPTICSWCLIRPRRRGGTDCLECHAQKEKDRRHRRKPTRPQLRTMILRATTLAAVDQLIDVLIDVGAVKVRP